MDIKLPAWADVAPSDIQNIDLGARYKPLTEAEIEMGMIARGPLIMIPAWSTSEAMRRNLPAPCHNIRLVFRLGLRFIEFETSPSVPVSIALEKGMFMTDNNRLFLATERHGGVRLRAVKAGDAALYNTPPKISTAAALAKHVVENWSLWS